jgi:tripartite ATP-independent transporter DctP family solute receptor
MSKYLITIRRRNLCAALSAAFSSLIFLALVSGGCKSERTKIILMAADDHPLDYPTTQGLVFMDRHLRERTNGRISLDIFGSKTLGEEKVTIEQTQLGIIDINRVNINPLVQISPELGVFALPYIFRDVDHMHAVLDGEIGEELLHSMESRNIIGLCYYDSGARSFYNTERPITKPSDLRGLKIRVQKSEIMMDMVKALGGSPTPMAFGEVFTSLQTGVIQGAENNWPSYRYTGHYQAAKYYSLDQHSMAPEMVIMSRRTWERLDPGDRGLIMEAAKASVPYQRKLWKDLEIKDEKVVRDNGNIINEIPDKTPFIEAMKPVYDKHVKDKRMRGLVARIREAGGTDHEVKEPNPQGGPQ